ALSVPYSGRVSFNAPSVTTTGLPHSPGHVIESGKTQTATIKVHNPGPASEDLFLDPRLPARQSFSLLSLTPDTNLDFPLPAGTIPPMCGRSSARRAHGGSISSPPRRAAAAR